MQLTKKHRNILKKIFTNPTVHGNFDSTNHAHNVTDIIFQTQVYLLGILDEARRLEFIDLQVNSLIDELRHGKNKDNYQVAPVDQSVEGNTQENNEFWGDVKTLLIEAVQWNYQAGVIKEGLKKKIFMHFLSNPSKSVSFHAEFIRNYLLRPLQAAEKDIFNREFMKIESWAKVVDQEYQAPGYPLKTVAASLFLTLLSYGLDELPGLSTLILATTEVTGAYLWGKYFPQPLSLNNIQIKKMFEDLNNEFLRENKLKAVCISSNKEDKVIYTKFNEKLPENSWIGENSNEEKKQYPRANKPKDEKPKFQRGKTRSFDVKEKEDEKFFNHQWDTASAETKNVVSTWGQYSQKNTYTFFCKGSPSIQKFKAKNKELYREYKEAVRSGHMVAPDAHQGIKKLERADGIYTHEAKLLGFGTGNLRFFGREEKSSDGATLIVFDRCGPALHKNG